MTWNNGTVGFAGLKAKEVGESIPDWENARGFVGQLQDMGVLATDLNSDFPRAPKPAGRNKRARTEYYENESSSL